MSGLFVVFDAKSLKDVILEEIRAVLEFLAGFNTEHFRIAKN
jgi:hypothetical protein